MAHVAKDVADLSLDVVLIDQQHLDELLNEAWEVHAFLYLVPWSCTDVRNDPTGFSSD